MLEKVIQLLDAPTWHTRPSKLRETLPVTNDANASLPFSR
jgi:hypothetical protein